MVFVTSLIKFQLDTVQSMFIVKMMLQTILACSIWPQPNLYRHVEVVSNLVLVGWLQSLRWFPMFNACWCHILQPITTFSLTFGLTYYIITTKL